MGLPWSLMALASLFIRASFCSTATTRVIVNGVPVDVAFTTMSPSQTNALFGGGGGATAGAMCSSLGGPSCFMLQNPSTSASIYKRLSTKNDAKNDLVYNQLEEALRNTASYLVQSPIGMSTLVGGKLTGLGDITSPTEIGVLPSGIVEYMDGFGAIYEFQSSSRSADENLKGFALIEELSSFLSFPRDFLEPFDTVKRWLRYVAPSDRDGYHAMVLHTGGDISDESLRQKIRMSLIDSHLAEGLSLHSFLITRRGFFPLDGDDNAHNGNPLVTRISFLSQLLEDLESQ